MVEDLLVLARAEAFTVVDPEPISLAPAATKLAESMQGRTGRVITVKVSPELPLAAGDLTFVERVLENLLSNAAKYSQPEAPIELAINRQCEGFVTLTVSDSGPGVPPAEMALIFNNFYRSTSAEKVASGHGIGLAVCKRLVEAMSGRIYARGAEAGGLSTELEPPSWYAGADIGAVLRVVCGNLGLPFTDSGGAGDVLVGHRGKTLSG
jgi:signal transduction histidine kinase